jgi:CHAT domain-containing protein
VRRGRAATVSAYRQLAAHADVLHLAVHAVVDRQAPGLSGLVLAGRGSRDLELLTADRIVRIALRARLVTLSACETARGAVRGREGVIGLARSLLMAGAQAVVASHWAVDDGSTERLMSRFYRRLARGEEPAMALSRARRMLRDQVSGKSALSRSHPFFWASFVLLERAAMPRRPARWTAGYGFGQGFAGNCWP